MVVVCRGLVFFGIVELAAALFYLAGIYLGWVGDTFVVDGDGCCFLCLLSFFFGGGFIRGLALEEEMRWKCWNFCKGCFLGYWGGICDGYEDLYNGVVDGCWICWVLGYSRDCIVLLGVDGTGQIGYLHRGCSVCGLRFAL